MLLKSGPHDALSTVPDLKPDPKPRPRLTLTATLMGSHPGQSQGEVGQFCWDLATALGCLTSPKP